MFLETTDTGALLGAMVERYGDMRLRAATPDAPLRIESRQAGLVSLERLRIGGRLDVSCGPSKVFAFARVRSGSADYGLRPRGVHAGRGDLVLTARPGETFESDTRGMDFDGISIAPGVFDELAEAESGGRVRILGPRAVSAAATRDWVRAFSFVRDSLGPPGAVSGGLAQGGSGPAAELVAGPLGRYLAAVTLTAFPNDAVIEPTHVDRHDGHPATLQRAVAFIEANPDLDLAPADVARAARVSPRAVQLAFRRHLGTTPMAYLRRVRLDRARAELQASVPGDGLTVTQVAARWGFPRPSRFAALYREAYGQSPGRVLQARRGGSDHEG